jgi:hypothetical protein
MAQAARALPATQGDATEFVDQDLDKRLEFSNTKQENSE